jgi:hypothetical protein
MQLSTGLDKAMPPFGAGDTRPRIQSRRILPLLLIPLLAGMLSACTSRNLYEAIQQNRLQRCEEIPIPQQANCRAQYQQSYEDYKNERDALLEDE